jgi:hypothetical protein
LTILTRFSLFLLILILMAGCAQRETDVGSNAITGQPRDTFLVVEGRVDTMAGWTPNKTNGLGTDLEVGQGRGLSTSFLIRFDVALLPDSFVVDSMNLRLMFDRVWIDLDTVRMDMQVRSILDTWVENSLTPGALPNRGNYPLIDSLVHYMPPDSFFTYEIPNATTLYAQWVADSAFGLLFEPRTEEEFVAFNSSQNLASVSTHPEYFPRLHLRGKVAGRDTTIEQIAGIDGYLTTDNTHYRSDRLYVTQGYSQRGALYFPLDSLTRNFSRSVNRAELHLFADATDSALIRYSDYYFLLGSGQIANNKWLTKVDSLKNPDNLGVEYSITRPGWDTQRTEYVLDVSGDVAIWVATPSANHGMQILPSNESGFLARESFYTNDPSNDRNKWPKLIVWYTESSQ